MQEKKLNCSIERKEAQDLDWASYPLSQKFDILHYSNLNFSIKVKKLTHQ